MRFRWLLVLILGSILVGPQAPAWAQAQVSSDPIRLLEQTDETITLDFFASFADFQQTPAYQAILAPASTRQASLSGISAFPAYSALIGLPPTGAVELQVLADAALPVNDARLLAADAAGVAQAQPQQAVRLVDEAWVRDRRVARIEYRPFQLQPGAQSALWHHSLRVTLRFSGAAVAGGQAVPAAAPGDDGVMQSQLLNAHQARTWRAAPALTGAVRDPFAAAADTPLGPRYKIVVDQDGLYQLTYANLQAAGLNLTGVDPRNIHLTSQGLAVPIYMKGNESDGVFDPTDILLFYGQKFRGERLAARHAEESSYYTTLIGSVWQPKFNAVQVEKYTAENVYWLTVEATPGLRTAALGVPPSAAPAGAVTRETVRFEQSNEWWTWHYTSEDTWFWDQLTLPTVANPAYALDNSYTLALPNPAPTGSLVHISGDLVARVSNAALSPDHHTLVSFNATPVEDIKWDGPTRHHFSGTVPQSALTPGGSNTLRIQVLLDAYPGQVTDDMNFDWVAVDYDRSLTAQGDALAFQASAPTNRYQVSGFTSPQVELWDVSQPLAPVRLFNNSFSGGMLDFETAISGTAQLIAAGSSAWKSPKRLEFYNPPDLLSAAIGADYLIITPAAAGLPVGFSAEVQRLAGFHQSRGLRVKIVDFADLVNQFNDGIYHPIAIKNFLAYTFLHWQAPAPAYAVLIGDGNFNLRGFNPAKYGSAPIYMPPNLAWVDYPDVSVINQGEVESTNLLANVVGLDPLPDLAIGRIPVNSTAQLTAVIDKILNYAAAPGNQDWQKRFFFIADDVPDPAGDFQAISNSLIADFIKAPYQPQTAYLTGNTTGEISAQNNTIINGFNFGALVASYVGHGSATGWGAMFNINHVSRLANGTRLPVVISLTCSDGYWITPPSLPSGFAEEMLRAPNQGAIATFSPTGFDDVYGHDKLQRGFMNALLKHYVTDLGALTAAARLNLYAGGSNLELLHQFVLFGDPALKLKLPFKSIYLPSIRH